MPSTKNNTKTSTKVNENKVTENKITEKQNEVVQSNNEIDNQNALAQMMQMMQTMSSQLSALTKELDSTKEELENTKNKLNEKQEYNIISQEELTVGVPYNTTGYYAPVQDVNISSNIPVTTIESTQSTADKFLEIMASRKSDREVTIVHNREIIGGGTTHIQLSTISIDFRHMGETRTLSWSQFEECVSKYHGFFIREIILVADKDREVAEEYKVPCVKRENGQVLTRKELDALPLMSMDNITKLYNSLTKNDKQFMLNYWLGQCYNRTTGFYDRYKIETLNSLSKTGVFDTLLAFMNGEQLNAGRNHNQNDMTINQQINLVGRA